MARTQQKIELGETEKKLLTRLKKSKLDGCKVEVIGSWIWISGETKQYVDKFKKYGMHFAPNKKAWYFHTGKYQRKSVTTSNINDIRVRYNNETIIEA